MLLAAIGILVPSDHWGLPPWKWVIMVLVVLAIGGLTIQLFIQSREDHDREKRDNELDERHQGIETKITELTQLVSKGVQLVPSSKKDASALPMNPPVDFNAAKYFQAAHQSAWTADVEKRIRVAAEQNSSLFSAEEFYSKFIGIGLVSYLHDITWAYIWKSQILFLAELNRQNGIAPISTARTFYSHGATDAPGFYTNYTFDQWLNFLQTQNLIIKHPSDMLEITLRGRDYLSYSTHNSRTADQRRG